MNKNVQIIKDITHEQWLEERKKGVGSSEAGTLMGVNHFDTPYSLWRKKMGLEPPQEETEAMAMGHIYEEAVAKRFASVTGAYIIESSAPDWIAVDKEHPWRRVSPDRLFYEKGAEHRVANWNIVECKTTSQEVDPLNVPLYWQYQLQYQMGVLGVRQGAIAWTSTAFRLHSGFQYFAFDQAVFDMIVAKVDTFWHDNILANKPPEFTTVEDVNSHYNEGVKKMSVTADATVAEACRMLKLLKAEKDILEKKMADKEMKIKAAMGDAEILLSPSGEKIATWNTCEGRMSFKSETFKKENEELYNKYLVKGSPYRQLKIK